MESPHSMLKPSCIMQWLNSEEAKGTGTTPSLTKHVPHGMLHKFIMDYEAPSQVNVNLQLVCREYPYAPQHRLSACEVVGRLLHD